MRSCPPSRDARPTVVRLLALALASLSVVACVYRTPIRSVSLDPSRHHETAGYLLEVTGVDVYVNRVALTLLYTNRRATPQRAWFQDAYLLDEQGYKYSLRGELSPSREFAPQVPERSSLVFGRARPDASWVTLVAKLVVTGEVTNEIVVRQIPLRP